MDWYLTEIAALNRPFELGDLYDYATEQIFKVDKQWTESDLMPEPEAYTKPSLKLICSSPHQTSKYETMDLDEHTKTSFLLEIINNSFSGASKYLDYCSNPTKATFTFICRLITTRKHLDGQNIASKSAKMNPNPNVSHVVSGIIYGVTAYCVLTQNFHPNESEEDDRMEIIKSLSEVAEKMKQSLLNNQDLIEFKQLLTLEENRQFDQLKCRLYSDLPTDCKCSVYEAYEHYFQLIKGIETGATTNNAVPIAVLLCPLDVKVIKTPRGDQISTRQKDNKDVDHEFVRKYCILYDELEEISDQSQVYRTSNNNHLSLRQFEATISKYQTIFTTSMQKAIVKEREHSFYENSKVKEVLKIASNHKFFQPSLLKQWLKCKQTELDMLKWMGNIPGITFMEHKNLKKKLVESFDKKQTLLLVVPDLGKWTHLTFRQMQDYVKSTKKYGYDFKETKDYYSHNDVPSLLDETMRNEVLDIIHQFIRHVERSKCLKKPVDYYITISSKWAQKACNYSIYNAGKLVMEKLDQLPSPPDNFQITESAQHKAKGSSSIAQLQWNYEDSNFPCHFVVQYRLKGTSDKSWEEKRTTKPGEMQMFINVKNGSAMEFRMATETGFGISEFNDIFEHEFGVEECFQEDADGEEYFVVAKKRKRLHTADC